MLTKRQEEFLLAVAELAPSGAGVHYTQVAEALGVSRWTAYDVLSSLVEKGLLSVSHEVDREGGVGRSRVLFQPTRRAWAILGQRRRSDSEGAGEVWRKTRQRLWARVAQAKEQGVWGTLQELAGELGSVRQPLVFCAYLLVMLLVALKAADQGDNQALLGYLLPILTGPQVALAVLVGFIMSRLVDRAPLARLESHGMNWQHLGLFEQEVKALTREEVRYLRDFAVDLIDALWPGQAARAHAGAGA